MADRLVGIDDLVASEIYYHSPGKGSGPTRTAPRA
jgi:hypothetical protein